jgi:hypothetical protein
VDCNGEDAVLHNNVTIIVVIMWVAIWIKLLFYTVFLLHVAIGKITDMS